MQVAGGLKPVLKRRPSALNAIFSDRRLISARTPGIPRVRPGRRSLRASRAGPGMRLPEVLEPRQGRSANDAADVFPDF